MFARIIGDRSVLSQRRCVGPFFCIALVYAFCVAALETRAADWVHQTTVPHYQQVNDLTPTTYPNFGQQLAAWYGCGAATAKMILESTEIGGTVRSLAQHRTDIQTQRAEGPNGNNNGGFYTDPVAMDWVIGQYDTRFGNATNHNRWIIGSDANVNDAAARLALTFDNYDTPSAGLVYKGGHWVAVTGVRTDVQPTTGAFSVKSFKINDPGRRNAKNQLIPWATWTRSYQTPIKHGTTYNGRFVNVVDPDPLDPPIDPSDLFEPIRPLPGVPIANAFQALTIADALILDWDLSSEFSGLTPLFAERVNVSHASDEGWWVGYGTDPGGGPEVSAGLLIDSDQYDLLVAGWDYEDIIPVADRKSYWPYLGDRVPTAGVSTSTDALFRIRSIPEPASITLLATGVLILMLRFTRRSAGRA